MVAVGSVDADVRDRAAVHALVARHAPDAIVHTAYDQADWDVTATGAAHLALATGSTLLGIACRYEGRRMRLVVSEPITAPGEEDAVAAMNQQLADFFAGQVRSGVEDWHMLQPFFAGVVAR